MVTPMTDEERQRAKERAMANKEHSDETMTKFNEAQQAFVEKLIQFKGDDPDDGFDIDGDVRGSVLGSVRGNVWGYVGGDVVGNVRGNVWGYVRGNVWGYVFGTVGKGQDDD